MVLGGVVLEASLGVQGALGNWPLVPSVTAPPSCFPCQRFFRAKQGQASMCLLVTPLGDPNIQRKVGGSREAAGALVGRLSSCSPPTLPTLVWLPAVLQAA